MMTNNQAANQTADSVTAINELENFSAQHDDDGIVTVTIDQSKRKMNVIGDGFTESFATIVDSFINDDAATGLILTSAKATFVVGADIDQLNQIKTAEQAFALTMGRKLWCCRSSRYFGCPFPLRMAHLPGHMRSVLGRVLQGTPECYTRATDREARDDRRAF